MINQQLLNYIKQQLQRGVDREKIKNSLLANGWQETDINEAFVFINSSNLQSSPEKIPSQQFSAPSQQPKRKKNKALLAIIFVIGLLVVSGGAYYGTEVLKRTEAPELSTHSQVIEEGEAIIENGEDEKAPLIVEGTVWDCFIIDDDEMWNCIANFANIFIANLKECQPAIGDVIIGGGEAFFGVAREYEIKGVENNKCVVQFRLRFGTASWEEVEQVFIEEGWAREEAEALIRLLNDQMICEYGPGEKILEYVAELEGCHGPLYNGMTEWKTTW